MGFSHEPVLLGDIGATNARFALLSNGVLGPIEYFTVAEFPRFDDVIDAFLDRDGRPLAGARRHARGCGAGRPGSLCAHQLPVDHRCA